MKSKVVQRDERARAREDEGGVAVVSATMCERGQSEGEGGATTAPWRSRGRDRHVVITAT